MFIFSFIYFLFLNQILWSDTHWNRLSEDDSNGGHIIWFGWEIKRINTKNVWITLFQLELFKIIHYAWDKAYLGIKMQCNRIGIESWLGPYLSCIDIQWALSEMFLLVWTMLVTICSSKKDDSSKEVQLMIC